LGVRRFIAATVVAVTILTGGLVLSELLTREQDTARTATSALGASYRWSSDLWVADPITVDRVLVASARAARVNVFRSSVGTRSDGRTHIEQYALIGAGRSGIARSIELASGRWFSASQSLDGTTVAVSTTAVDGAEVVGRPRVTGDRFDLTVAPMRAAFTRLPTAGMYTIESSSPARTDRFLAAVRSGLEVEGTPSDVARSAFSRVESPEILAPIQWTRFGLPGLVVVCWTLAMTLGAAGVLRAAKAFAVGRILGVSTTRTWFHVVGAASATAAAIGVVAVAGVVEFIPQISALAWTEVFVAATIGATTTLVSTAAVGVAVARRVPVIELVKGRL
jgi:hypothetical protein